MNINLHNLIAKDDLANSPLGNVETLWEAINRATEILGQHEDTAPVAPPVLVPFDADGWVGVYTVWFPVASHENKDGEGQWVSVNPDGVIERIDYLPTAYEMLMEAGN